MLRSESRPLDNGDAGGVAPVLLQSLSDEPVEMFILTCGSGNPLQLLHQLRGRLVGALLSEHQSRTCGGSGGQVGEDAGGGRIRLFYVPNVKARKKNPVLRVRTRN